MQSLAKTVVILGSGGTIAGRAASAQDNVGYAAGQIDVDDLVAAVPALASQRVEAEQVAQVDSKDMGAAVWQRLVARAAHHLARDEVAGVVVTHGTDTLEESAWLLHRVLAPAKPLVLTAAMRPASSLQADGPQNLLDAVAVARHAGAAGVVAVLAGRVHGAADVRKAHSYRVDAFDSGDAGPLALVEEGKLRLLRPWPQGNAPLGPAHVALDAASWPWVELLTSHAGACAAAVDALTAAGVRGLVVAGTGNGTVHEALQQALQRAHAGGVAVRRATRCAAGPVLGSGAAAAWPTYDGLNAVKARLELVLELLTPRST